LSRALLDVYRGRALILLLVLSPALPELLTGSTPPSQFILPHILLVLIVIYGFPAVLVRDYLHRLGSCKYTDLLKLGLALGVLVEGLAVNTYYTTDPETVDIFAEYGRILGVNISWVLYITIFHSIYSLTIPVKIVDLLHPELNGVELVESSRKKKLMLLAVVLVVILFNTSGEVYKPPPYYYVLSLTLIVLIIKLHRLEKRLLPARLYFPRRLLILYPLVLVVFAFFTLPRIAPPALHLGIGILLYVLLYNTLQRAIKPEEEWVVARNLLLGMCITALVVAVLTEQYSLLLPALLFSLIVVVISRRMERYRVKH